MGIWRLVLTVFLAVGWVGSVQASTTELKTGAARTYQVPLYDGTGSAADQDRYGRYTIAEILGLVEVNDVDGLTDFITNTAAVAAAMKDAPTVISALDTYFGSANWRADVVAAVALNTAKTGITAQQAADITANNAKVSYPGDELSADQQAAIDNANTPSAANPFATQNDVVSGGGAVDSVFGRTGAVVANANDYSGIYAPALGADDNYVTDAEKVVIGNTSGTNTGDQDLSGYLLSADLTYSLIVGKWTSCTSGYLKYDGTCDTPAAAGDLLSTNNLSDLTDANAARTNLGLGTAAITASTAYATAAQGATADTALQPADMTTHTGAVDPHPGYMLESNIGTSANNYIQLDSNGDLPFAIGFTAPDGTGNLAATDDTLEELAVAVDGLVTGGGDNLGTATATDVSALFSGAGDYLKSDGTKGTPAGGTLTITEQSSDPSFSEMSTGDLIISTASGDLFYKSATGGYTLTGAYTADPVTYSLTVTDPGNNDAITCSDSDLSQAINCGNGGTDCTATAADGASITGLTATADTGRQFDNWTGDVIGTENPTTTALIMSGSNKAVQGMFSATASSLFYWDAESSTANTSTGTIVGVASNSPTFSTDHVVAGTYSLKCAVKATYYKFTDPTIFNSSKGVVTFYIYGNSSDGLSAQVPILLYGDSANTFSFKLVDPDKIQVYAKLTGTSKYFTSDAGSMISNSWNKVEFNYDNTSGSTVWSFVINDSAAGSGSSTSVWDSGVGLNYIEIGPTSSTAITVPMYIDVVTVE